MWDAAYLCGRFTWHARRASRSSHSRYIAPAGVHIRYDRDRKDDSRAKKLDTKKSSHFTGRYSNKGIYCLRSRTSVFASVTLELEAHHLWIRIKIRRHVTFQNKGTKRAFTGWMSLIKPWKKQPSWTLSASILNQLKTWQTPEYKSAT